ncbi:hypothetical protein WAI453_002123 [Rhynchosporium graminicola]|uniref:Zn(2)-C6 fungal-type domain-containing protein n=1 Tax=Rhynchosporium graminicola TaxID=2792576 RepID=A0A1E1KWK9_9HELO|nr:uncharacterized protein RCO7_09412 [Rhynchosporium commune]
MHRTDGGISSEQAPAVRTRRSNGKSRLGCMACKQKRIKCDELRPKCSRCKSSSQGCVYPANDVPKWQSSVSTFSLPAASESRSPSTASATSHKIDREHSVTPSPPYSGFGEQRQPPLEYDNSFFGNFDWLGHDLLPMPIEQSPIFETHDLLLLIHFTSTTSRDLIGPQQLWTEDAMQLALQHSFLMHTILALSARHLQKVPCSLISGPEPDYKLLEEYHHHEAVTAFHADFQSNLQSNRDALIAASFLISFHACSILDFNPTAVLPARDTSLTFLRYIPSILADRPIAAQSGPFQILVEPRLFLPHVTPSMGPGAQFMSLLNHLPTDAPALVHRDTYIERIESLTLYLSTSTSKDLQPSVLEELLSCFLRWQSMCPSEFITLLDELDGIALVLLSYYYAAVAYLLSSNRGKWWWCHEKPAYMVGTIGDYLGRDWAHWMEWPRGMIQRVGNLSSS